MPRNLIPLALLIAASSYADPNWEAITTPAHPNCDSSSHCRILETNGNFEISLIPHNDKWGQNLNVIEIRNLQSGKVESYKMDGISSIGIKEYFKLFKIKFRPKSPDFDLAVRAFDSAQGGTVYYYFVYDPAEKKFIMSDDPIPQVTYNSKSKQFMSRALHVKYEIGPDFKLHKR